MPGIIDPTRSVQVDLSKAIPFLPIIPAELLRDLLAAFTVVGLTVAFPDNTEDDNAALAYKQADALLKAREKSD